MRALERLFAGKAAYPNISEDGTYAVTPWLSWLGFQTHVGGRVTEDSAYAIPTVKACVRVLAEDVATLPLIVYRRLPGGGKERADDHHLYPVLHDQPNPEMTSVVWRETLMAHLGLWGNSFNEIIRDDRGRTQIWPIPPHRIEVKWEAKRRVYYYREDEGDLRRLRDGSVFHVPGLSFNGLVGKSPVGDARETYGEQIATRDFGAHFYRNMARPATVLAHPKNLSEPAIQRLRTQMEDIRGSGNAGKTVILEEGMTFDTIGVPPEDAQFIETRKFQREEVAALFRMPPHKVGILDHATFSNIEHQAIDYVTGTLRPWLVRIEQAIKMAFLPEPDIFAEFLVDGLLRGDAKARAEALDIQRRNGVINADDWNELENRNPLPDGVGKTYWMPVNMQPAQPPDAEPVPEPENGNGALPFAEELERIA